MKWLLVLLVLGGLGYLGYTHQAEISAKIAEWRGAATQAVTSPAPGSPSAPGASEAPSAPSFQSKIDVPSSQPGEKHLAPPGTYYMKKRTSHDTDSGVVAVSPAEPVTLLERLKDGHLKVVRGTDIFVVAEADVTNDLDEAREIEKREFVAHGGKL